MTDACLEWGHVDKRRGNALIISHQHKFIFVRTRKVASSSLEVCLSRLLTPDDFATHQTERDKLLGHTLPELDTRIFRGFDRFGLPLLINGHSALTKAYRLFGAKIESYQVITAERDPWDRAVSIFYWSHRRTDMKTRPMEQQIAQFRAFAARTGHGSLARRIFGISDHRSLSQKHLYMINGVSMVVRLLRFECLDADLLALSQDLGLATPLAVAGINAKVGHRAGSSRDLRAFFDAPTRDLVASACAWETAAYGYDFDTRAVPAYLPDPARFATKAAYIARFGKR